MQKVVVNFLSFLIILLFLQCATPQVVEKNASVEVDNRYDSEFPNKSISDQLEFVSNTIKKLEVLAFYETYVFPEENILNEKKLTSEQIEKQSISKTISNESVIGTATVVYYDGLKVGLLTCAHVIDFPDTIIKRFDNGTGPIQIIAIKLRQQNFAAGLPDGEDVKLLATDPKNDIAFLMKKLDDHVIGPKVLNYPVGNTRDFEWGSIVYVMGFPVGQKMVTRAIVSNPKSVKKKRFITDALYNRGISGAPVLAIRDGVPNFEWVGMATSAAINNLFYAKPVALDPEFINPEEVYEGSLFVDHVKNIKYGVTFNVTIEAITKFFKDIEDTLEQHGFAVERMFK